MNIYATSYQPREFAEVATYYSDHSARCVCEDTITLGPDGEWRHSHRTALGERDIWCRPNH